MKLHRPGDVGCKACTGEAFVHEACRKNPKGVIHRVIENSYTDDDPEETWERCDACGVKPRREPEVEIELADLEELINEIHGGGAEDVYSEDQV